MKRYNDFPRALLSMFAVSLLVLSLSFVAHTVSGCSSVPPSTVSDVCGTARAVCSTADAICKALGGGSASLEELKVEKARLDSLRTVLRSEVSGVIVSTSSGKLSVMDLSTPEVRALVARLDSLAGRLSDAITARTAAP